MRNITLENITRAVIEHGDGGKIKPRLYECYASLVKHLHAFAREVKLTEPELDLGATSSAKSAAHGRGSRTARP